MQSLQIVMLSQQVVSCQEAPIMIYKQGVPHNNGLPFAKVSFDKGQLLLLLLKDF